MLLTDWISEIGTAIASKKLRVSPRQIRAIRAGDRFPSAALCSRIPKATEGMVNALHEVFPAHLFNK